MMFILFSCFIEIATFPVGIIENEMAGPDALIYTPEGLILVDRFKNRIVRIQQDSIVSFEKIENSYSYTLSYRWYMKGDTTFLDLGNDNKGNHYLYAVMPSWDDYRRYLIIEKGGTREFQPLPRDYYEYGVIGKHIVVAPESCKVYIFFTDEKGVGHIWVYY